MRFIEARFDFGTQDVMAVVAGRGQFVPRHAVVFYRRLKASDGIRRIARHRAGRIRARRELIKWAKKPVSRGRPAIFRRFS